MPCRFQKSRGTMTTARSEHDAAFRPPGREDEGRDGRGGAAPARRKLLRHVQCGTTVSVRTGCHRARARPRRVWPELGFSLRAWSPSA